MKRGPAHARRKDAAIGAAGLPARKAGGKAGGGAGVKRRDGAGKARGVVEVPAPAGDEARAGAARKELTARPSRTHPLSARAADHGTRGGVGDGGAGGSEDARAAAGGTPAVGAAKSTPLRQRVTEAGGALARGLAALVAGIPGSPRGPVQVARAIGVDKVMASRVLKAAGAGDAVATLSHAPGPAPLRRFVRAAAKHGVSREAVDEATRAVDGFERLTRDELRDRRSLDALLSAWLPESRAEFELRRKQAVFRAMSELRGAAAERMFGTAIFWPSADGEHIDVAWLCGWLGLRRLRPGAPVKFATRRVGGGDSPRRPRTLDGREVEGMEGLLLERYCTSPRPRLSVMRAGSGGASGGAGAGGAGSGGAGQAGAAGESVAGDVVHYALGDHGFGPGSEVDLVFAEVSRGELVRYVPNPGERKRHAFVEVTTPCAELVFDLFVHPDLLGRAEPTLHVYDTSFEGVASVNDPRRDADRLDLAESVQRGRVGVEAFGLAGAGWYTGLLREACATLGWDGAGLVGHRCAVQFPLYGTQVVLAFPAQGR